MHRTAGAAGPGRGLGDVVLDALVGHVVLPAVDGDEARGGARAVTRGTGGGWRLVQGQGVLVRTLESGHRGFVQEGGQGGRHREEKGDRHWRGPGVGSEVGECRGGDLRGIRRQARPVGGEAKCFQALPEFAHIRSEREKGEGPARRFIVRPAALRGRFFRHGSGGEDQKRVEEERKQVGEQRQTFVCDQGWKRGNFSFLRKPSFPRKAMCLVTSPMSENNPHGSAIPRCQNRGMTAEQGKGCASA